MSGRLLVVIVLVLLIQLAGCHVFRQNKNGNVEKQVKWHHAEQRLIEHHLQAPGSCNIDDLELGQHGEVIKCFLKPNAGDFSIEKLGSVPEETKCLVSLDVDDKNSIALRECKHGNWTASDLGPKKKLHRRFLGIIVGTVAVIACVLLCGGGDGGPPPPPKIPPKFSEPCRPYNVDNNYNVPAGRNGIYVTWEIPSATDPDGHGASVTVTQTDGNEPGSYFEGSVAGRYHHITYKARDTDGQTAYCSFEFKVTIKTCGSPAPWINNGRRRCSQNNQLGSVCTYTCNIGYEISGSSQITCQGNYAHGWSATPTCKRKTCSTPPAINNGAVNCDTRTPNEYLKVCPVACNHNYTLSGNAFYTQCQVDGTWLSVDSIKCKDSSPPQLSCKTPQVFYADRNSTSTAVEWVLPTVTDTLDQNPSFKKTSNQLYGSQFQTGNYFVTYKATDSDGNESPECLIEIRVEETTCQHPAAIIQDSNMAFTVKGTKYTYGTEASLSCKFNIPLVGSNLLTCEREKKSTDLSVGVWSWGSGVQPFCNITDCPDLDPPINGASAVTYIGSPPVKIITMLCNNHSDIPFVSTSFNGMFYCQTDGTYLPPFDMPDCIKPKNARVTRLPGEIYYYGGNCNDQATQEVIKANLSKMLANISDVVFQKLCPPQNKCTITDLTLTCGDSGRRKRHVVIERGLDLIPKRTQSNRPRRDHGIEKSAASPTMIVYFYLDTKINPEIDFLNDLNNIDKIQDSVVAALQRLLTKGTLNIENFTTNNQSLRAPEYGDIICDTGLRLKQTKCLPCPYGYFLNAASLCELCPLGFYADESGLTSCKVCPSGQTTPSKGSKSQNNCVQLCPAGQYSAKGFVPCTPCAVSHYQDQIGQTACTQCTTGTTARAGSTSISECQEFNLLLDDTSGPVTATASTVTMTDLTLTLWVKRYADEPTNAHIRLTSGSEDILVLSFTDVINVQLPNPRNTFDMTIGKLSSSTWSHVAISWDTSSEELSIYLNGHLAYNCTMSTPNTPLILNGSILMQSSGVSGVYIADLHLEDAVVSPSDISVLSSSCWTTRTEVFGMSDFRNRGLPGINIQTPLSCDPIDECVANPCNNHTCVNGINDYTCYCSGGWTGNNCDTPPNYCLDNGCTNGATCVSGTSTFTCTCQTGYSGDLCEVAPVDGGWSEWSSWTSCTVTCSGGNQTRLRSCDSPEPSPNGANCTGDASETQTCGSGTCPTCTDLYRGSRMLPHCMLDQSTGDQTCQISCRDGYVLPASLQSNEYKCGISTEYKWSPNNNPPDCEDPDKPSCVYITASITTTTTISSNDSSAVQLGVLDNLSGVPCVQAGICTPSVDIATPNRTKINTGSIITVTLTKEMTEKGTLNIQEYIFVSTANPSLQELIDAINSLESSAAYINSSYSSIFEVTVNGVTYTSSQSTLVLSANVTCPTGQTATDGVCVPCPEGTYYTNGYCTFCNKGTYASTSGQTSCAACPAGLTTVTIGSYAASQCTETTTPQGSGTYQTSDKTAMYAGLALALAAFVVSTGVCAFVVFRKKMRNNKTPRADSKKLPFDEPLSFVFLNASTGSDAAGNPPAYGTHKASIGSDAAGNPPAYGTHNASTGFDEAGNPPSYGNRSLAYGSDEAGKPRSSGNRSLSYGSDATGKPRSSGNRSLSTGPDVAGNRWSFGTRSLSYGSDEADETVY